jgi:hypothetical protein
VLIRPWRPLIAGSGLVIHSNPLSWLMATADVRQYPNYDGKRRGAVVRRP